MAVTKILARKGRLDIGIDYILNGDKTEQKILTAHQGCEPGRECRQMLETKRDTENMGGVQYYHIVQSFKPGEISPELALKIAKTFAAEYLDGYEAVIATHVDRGHIHSHIVFNSVNADTGEKYHSNARSYYCQIRAISDRLCREHGLSVILSGEASKSMSYVHFFLLMEHKGYEIRHGNRLGFRLRGQERFQYPGRKNAAFTEDGIRAAILGNLEEIETGQRAAFADRPMFRPYRRHPKYTGFLALYVHYLYLLGKIEQRQYPPRMTPHLRQEVMKFEQYRTQFAFLRENNISTTDEMTAYQSRTEETLANLMKQRTILNVRKKKRQALYDALADVEALAPAKALYENGLSGMEDEFARYMQAVRLLEQCGIPPEHLTKEKTEVYNQLADLNRQIRAERKKLALCREIQTASKQMEEDIRKTETRGKEVEHDEHRRR